MQEQPLSVSPAEKKPPYISCLLACVALLYITHLELYPLWDLIGLGVLCVFCVLYAVLLVTSDVRFIPLPPVICAVSLLARGFFADGFTESILQGLVNLVFCLLAALALYVCTIKKASKSVTFAVLCVFYAALLATHLYFLIERIYGAFSFEILNKAIDDLTAYAEKIFTALLGNASQASLTGAKNAAETDTVKLEQAGKTLAASVRAALPSFAVCFSMMGSALTLLVYKPIICAMHAQKACLDGRVWRFSVSSVSVIMFYVSYIIYFIAGLTGSNSVAFIAFMNLSTILTYPFAYLGLRFFNGMLCAKTKSRAASAAILAFGFVILGLFFGLGGLLITVFAFAGAAAQLNENLRSRFSGIR